MPDPYLQAMAVRPIRPDERMRFDEELDRHHWLGHNLVGETMRHVAVAPDGSWAALVGYGAAALACAPRVWFTLASLETPYLGFLPRW